MADLPHSELNILANALDRAAGEDREVNGRELEAALRSVREQVSTFSSWANTPSRGTDVAMAIEDAARLAVAHLAADIDPAAPAIPAGSGSNPGAEKRAFLARTAARIL